MWPENVTLGQLTTKANCSEFQKCSFIALQTHLSLLKVYSFNIFCTDQILPLFSFHKTFYQIKISLDQKNIYLC